MPRDIATRDGLLEAHPLPRRDRPREDQRDVTGDATLRERAHQERQVLSNITGSETEQEWSREAEPLLQALGFTLRPFGVEPVMIDPRVHYVDALGRDTEVLDQIRARRVTDRDHAQCAAVTREITRPLQCARGSDRAPRC